MKILSHLKKSFFLICFSCAIAIDDELNQLNQKAVTVSEVKIHRVSAGTLCPMARFVSFDGKWFQKGHLSCNCLVIESNHGLMLVDTGIGTRGIDNPKKYIGDPFLYSAFPQLSYEHTLKYQIEKLGYKSSEVKHVFLTHLDLDHAGGLYDFREAVVHVLYDEYQATKGVASSSYQMMRYRIANWGHDVNWFFEQLGNESFFGLPHANDIFNDASIIMAPLFGHSRGHVGFAIQQKDGWVLHAGDSFLHHQEIAERPRCPIGLSLLQSLEAYDSHCMNITKASLRTLQSHAGGLHIINSHDPHYLEYQHG